MAVDIAREADVDFQQGHTTVGTSKVQVTTLDLKAEKGVLVRCPGSTDPVPNTVPVWIGGPGVTADSAVTGGVPLVPGASLFIPIDRPTKLWVVSSAVSQDIAWLCV